jgi:hypothetical protein
MSHQSTRGTWIAPEARDPLTPGWNRTPYGFARYSVSAQVTVAALVRWLLVLEDPESDTLWLGKGIPIKWLADGNTVAVDDAPTRWGKVSFSITSHIRSGSIEARLRFPDAGIRAETRLRLRAGTGFTVKSVTVNGKKWSQFDPGTQVVVLPSGSSGTVTVVARD